MAVKDDKVRKLVTLPKTLWERVRRYRFANEINTESEALRRLIDLGLLKDNTDTPISVMSDDGGDDERD